MKKLHISVDARGAGQGKTRTGIYPMLHTLAASNTPTLIVVPSQLLQEQYCVDNPKLNIRKINSAIDTGTGLNVTAEILQAMGHREPLLIITEEAFRRTLISWDIKNDYSLIIDEAINPYSLEELSIDPKIALQLDNVFTLEEQPAAWTKFETELKPELDRMVALGEITLNNANSFQPRDWTSLKRTTLDSSSIFDESYQWRRLLNPNSRLWVTWPDWEKIRTGDTREIAFACELDASMLMGWIQVHIAAAAFETTFMSMWLKANGLSYVTKVKFTPHTQSPVFHMPDNKFSWSKYRRNQQPRVLPDFYRYVESKLQGAQCLVVRNNDEASAKLSNEIKLTHNVHGMNNYSSHTAVCLSTALKPSWTFNLFLKQRCTDAGIAEAQIDSFISRSFASYMFYQILMRSALRVEGNKQPVHCFILDTEVALGLCDYFDSSAQVNTVQLFSLKALEPTPRMKSKIAMTPAERQKRYRANKSRLAQMKNSGS